MTVKIALTLYYWEKENLHFVYSPALDLTGYGKTQTDAQKSFELVLEEYSSYTSSKNTIYDDLEKIGWTVNRSKKIIEPPGLEVMLEKNKEFKNIIETEYTQKSNIEIEFALP